MLGHKDESTEILRENKLRIREVQEKREIWRSKERYKIKESIKSTKKQKQSRASRPSLKVIFENLGILKFLENIPEVNIEQNALKACH